MQAKAKYYGPQLKKWKINALNTLTSTANNSASTNASKNCVHIQKAPGLLYTLYFQTLMLIHQELGENDAFPRTP